MITILKDVRNANRVSFEVLNHKSSDYITLTLEFPKSNDATVPQRKDICVLLDREALIKAIGAMK